LLLVKHCVLPETSGDTSAEQTVVFIIDDFITLADGFFQALPVNYRNSSANVFNQFSLRQFLSRQRNAFAAHTEHIGDKVVRHYQFIRVNPVVDKQQPAAKLLFNRMQTVANGGL
jgi:hypothetical protein